MNATTIASGAVKIVRQETSGEDLVYACLADGSAPSTSTQNWPQLDAVIAEQLGVSFKEARTVWQNAIAEAER